MKYEWQECTIGDLGQIVTGKTPPTKNNEYWGGKVMFITPKDIQATKHIFKTERYVTSEGKVAVRGAILPKGSICVSCIGNIGYLGITTEECISNQQINSIIVNENNDIDFVYYLLKSLWAYFKNYEGQSTALSILNKTQFSKIKVQIPNIEVQKKIASVLKILDEKIELNNAINNNLEQQAQALFEKLFSDTKSYKNFTLGNVTTNIRERIGDENAVVLSAVNIGKLQPSDEFFTKRVYSKDISKYIIVREGTFAYNPARINIGSIGINDLGITGCVSPVYVVFSVDDEYQSFFEFYFKTETFRAEAMLRASGSVRQSLNYSDFALIKIQYPDRKTAKMFNDFWLHQKSVILQLKRENSRLEELRDSLLPRLMTGELDVSDIDL